MDEGMVIPCLSFFNCISQKQDILSIKNKFGIGLSAGAAIRYTLPVGVISLEYGFSLIHEDKHRVHLLLGYVI
jgi:outer membrane protein assembly factor BamA